MFEVAQFASRNTNGVGNDSQFSQVEKPCSQVMCHAGHPELFCIAPQFLPPLCCRTLLKWWMGSCMTSWKESAEKLAEREQLM